jgi:UDP-glucose 4-epimerase
VNQSIKHVVITGGCGYIGSHIAKAMQRHGGYRVTVIDRVSRRHTLKYCDQFLIADYDSDETYIRLCNDPPDAIVHCAGSLLVGESVVNPALYYDNNVAKTARFLDQVRQLPHLPVIVFSSSAAVYGNPASVPITELSTIQPINPYGHTKAIVEQMLADFDHAYGLKSVCLRYFNACGADNDIGQEVGASHIIARLLDAKLANNTFTLNGTDFNTTDGTCVRDYIHVNDLATAHITAIDYLLEVGESNQFNLGTNEGISNQQIINQVLKTVGHIDIQTGPRRIGDPDILIADATKAWEVLAWEAEYSSLETIVTSAWDWYQHREL